MFVVGLVFFLFASISESQKTICVKRQFSIANGGFYQRIESSSAVDCVERCVESADSCKAVVFVENAATSNGHKKKSLCQFYNFNSEDRPADIRSATSLEPISTLFEVLENCPLDTLAHSRDFFRHLTPTMKRLLSALPKRKKNAEKELTLTIGDQSAASDEDENFVIGFDGGRERDDVSHRETYLSKPEYPFDGQKATNRKGNSEDYSNDLGANGGDAGAPVPAVRRPKPPVDLSNLKPISPVAVSHGGIPVPSGYTSNGQSRIDCRNNGCGRPSVSYPCPPFRLPNDPCNENSVPISMAVDKPRAFWSEWHPFGTCSVTCGNGVRQRRRSCSSGNDADCPGEAIKEEVCHLPECDVWGDWTQWSRCSPSCGGGQRTRNRVCRNGKECEGPTEDIKECGEEPCPVWKDWSEWSGCSALCGRGVQRRSRECIPKGGFCSGAASEQKSCEEKPCPHWSQWEHWSDCTKTCGMGERTRRRECLHGLGDDCTGPSEDHMFCNPQPCPSWGQWTNWSPCSVSCGDEGTRLRTRDCTYQGFPSHDCPGPAQDQSACQLAPCPRWGSWSSWSSCSASCGHGQQKRTRDCEPRGFGCTGGDQEIRFCQQAVCPYFTQWTEWTPCTATCGRGMTERRRKCIKDDPLPGAVLPSEEELGGGLGGGLGGSLSGGLESLRPEPDQSEEKLKTPEDKEAIKAHLIERSKNISTKAEANRPRLREQTLEVTQSASMQLPDRRRAPLKATMSAVTDSQSIEGCSGAEMETHECSLGPCCEWTKWSPWGDCTNVCGETTRVRTRSCHIQSSPSASSSPLMSRPTRQFSQSDFLVNGVEFGEGIRRRRQIYSSGSAYATASQFHPGSIQPLGSPPPLLNPGTPFASQMSCNCPGKAMESEHCDAETSNSNDCDSDSQKPTPIGGRVRGGGGNDGRKLGNGKGTIEPIDGSGSRNRHSGHSDGHSKSSGGRSSITGSRTSGGIGSSVEITDEKTNMEVSGSIDSKMNCQWGDWGAWNSCRGSCPTGTRARTRACKRGNTEDNDHETYSTARKYARDIRAKECECEGDTVETEECRPSNCESGKTERDSPPLTDHRRSVGEDPVLNCYWSDWGDWSDCGENGKKRRTRLCVGLKALLIDCQCPGPAMDEIACPKDSIDDITRDRFSETKLLRQLDVPTFQREDIEEELGPLTKINRCNWLSWTEWSECEAACESEGIRKRTRACPCRTCTREAAIQTQQCQGDPCLSARNHKRYPFD